MPSQEIVDTFVATVTGGDYVGAIERFYAPGASMRENQDEPRVGREALVRHEQGMMNMFSIAAEIIGAPLIAGDHAAIQWRFVSTLPNGAKVILQEVAWQRWEGDRIVEETFFYDPKQMTPVAG